MGHCKGKQIIYLCVDLVVVFVPLVTLPFQMSEDLIWAVSKCVASPKGSLATAPRVTETAGSEDVARAANSSESLHEYGLSEFEEWAPLPLPSLLTTPHQQLLSPTLESRKEKWRRRSACGASGGGRSREMAGEWKPGKRRRRIVSAALFVRV